VKGIHTLLIEHADGKIILSKPPIIDTSEQKEPPKEAFFIDFSKGSYTFDFSM
jgi:hypothetical protein